VLQTVLVSLGVVILAAWVVRRLLGINRGRWAATLAAVVIGQAATIGILQAVTGHALSLSWRWVPVGLALVAALSMLTLALFELLARLRTRRRSAALLHPLASVSNMAGRTARYAQVSTIALRHGLVGAGGDDPEIGGSRLGRSLAATFEEAGGLFVKLGQAMASQPQLVTPAVAAEMARLQDQAAPADPAAARAAIHEEIGPPEEIFAEFSPDPVAAASIAQTYFARLKDGRPVVVKVQRPGIRESMERDLDILDRLAERLDRRTAWARQLGLKELVAGFAEATREELDFRFEAANVAAARQALQDSEPISVPEIMDEFTTRRVLVEERVEGRSLATPGILDGLDAGQRRILADALLSLMMRQMAGGERFHADPHPGNVFLRPDRRLALIDFGAVGRLNRFERAGLIDIFRALQTEDPALLRQAALRIGTQTTRIDADALDRELARLLSAASRPDGTLNPAIFGDALFVFRDFGIVLPRSATTLFRTLVTLVGTLELIAPRYDLAEGVRRLSGEVMAQEVLPASIQEFIQQQALSVAPVLARLPGDVHDLARSLLRGEFRTRVSLFSEPEDLHPARSMLNRLVISMIGSAIALASAILLTVSSRPGQDVSLVDIVGGIGLSFSVLLLLRVVVQILRERG
jgi:ubiquinone biosynthesis protein